MGETRRPIPNGPLTGGAYPAVVDVFPSRWPSDETAVRELAAALAAWWSKDDGSMPGSGSWEADGGWDRDARVVLEALTAASLTTKSGATETPGEAE